MIDSVRVAASFKHLSVRELTDMIRVLREIRADKRAQRQKVASPKRHHA